MAGAFTGGMGDYVALFEPVASTLKERAGYLVASIGRDSGEIPYRILREKSYIRKNPKSCRNSPMPYTRDRYGWIHPGRSG